MPHMPPTSDLQKAPATILVADDDRLSREIVASLLRSHGYIVETVPDGQAVLDRVARGGIDLVLLDLMMPKLSGLETCRLLKGMAGDSFLPVVLVTVKTDSDSRVEGLKIGADDYVCKPFEEKELVARIEAMLRIKRLHDHVAKVREKLEQLSVHDELTGLYNYRYLHTRLWEEMRRAERHHEPLACVLIDIDRLKAHNEACGDAVGDAILCGIADIVRKAVREIDVVCRYGGEEILVVLPGMHFAGGIETAERIFRGVRERRFPVEGKPPRKVTVSIGVALFPSRDVRTREALLRAADAALHQAKREGGDRICVFQQQGQIFSPTVGLDNGPGRS